MTNQSAPRPSAAMVVAIVALVVAIGGTAIIAQAGGGDGGGGILGFAQVRQDGSVVAKKSEGIRSSNVNSLSNGVYCFKGIRGVRGGQVTSDYLGGGSSTTVSQFGLGVGSGCPANTRFFVSNTDAGPSGGFPESAFFILLYR